MTYLCSHGELSSQPVLRTDKSCAVQSGVFPPWLSTLGEVTTVPELVSLLCVSGVGGGHKTVAERVR